MTRLFAGSLQRRMLALMLITTLVALIVALGAMITYDVRAYHQGWVNDMTTQAALLGRTTTPALSFDDAKMARENLDFLRSQPRVRAAALYDAKGRLFASYQAKGGVATPLPPHAEPEGTRIERRNLILFQPIVENGEVLGTVYLRADYELYDRLVNYSGIALVVTLLGMGTAFLVSLRLQKAVTRPILDINTIAREVIQQGDYSRRAEKISSDEVGTLVESFNNMLAEIERRTLALEASNLGKAAEVVERRLAEQEILRLNEALERRVQERTQQLESSNHDLARASEAAESANRAKSEFLSSMSHELRTPLNAIIGFGQLLSMDNLPSSPEQRKTFSSHIVNAGRHLLALINDILNLAQIESGKLTLSLEPVNLDEVLAECQSMVEPLAAMRHINVVFPARCDLNVVADHTRLKQILLNLLSNAIKYNRDTGTVRIECTRLGADDVRIAVQDTGMGLRPDQVDALFQPFNRLGQEAGPQEGTGIGLVVTKKLAKLMGGDIGVHSTVGLGSVFWIDLKAAAQQVPINPALMASSPLARQPNASTSKPGVTVLYVEDNPVSLKLVEQILTMHTDVKLISAPDARMGIDLARAHVPDVILMDINLPGLDGNEAQAILSQDPATAHIPVIAVTANAMPRTVAEGLQAGFFRYVTKPIDIDDFLQTLHDALELSAQHAH